MPATGDVVATTVVAAYMLTLRVIFTMLLVARVVVVDRGCVDRTATTTRPLVQVAKPIGHFYVLHLFIYI